MKSAAKRTIKQYPFIRFPDYFVFELRESDRPLLPAVLVYPHPFDLRSVVRLALQSLVQVFQVLLWTTTIQFSEISHAAYALATPGSTHHLLAMHIGSLMAGWLCLPGGTCALSIARPLANISQFHDILLDPKALDFNRHENLMVMPLFLFATNSEIRTKCQ